MLPAENTATRPTPAILPPTIQSATPLPFTQFDRLDVQAIGAEVSALAASDPGAAANRYSSAQGMMTPVEIVRPKP